MGQLERLVKGGAEGMVRGGVGGAAADQPPNAQVSVEEARAMMRCLSSKVWANGLCSIFSPCLFTMFAGPFDSPQLSAIL